MKMNSEYILKIDSITTSFSKNLDVLRGENKAQRFNVIDELSLEIPTNKITALIGGNGAGKTTLFNVVSGLMHTDSGRIFFNNNKKTNLIGLKPHAITRLGIGRLFQDNHIFLGMTVLENMMISDSDRYGEAPFFSLLRPKKIFRREKEKALKAKNIFRELFGEPNPFWDKKDSTAGSLSYGQQRLLALARIFMGDYRLVLLDEPTSGINPDLIDVISAIIKRMPEEKGITVFLIEHNMKFVLEISNYCNFMSHGRIAAFGTPRDVIGNKEVRRIYLGA